MPDYDDRFNSRPICGAYVHTIEDLDLTAVGFPGLSFNGDLAIDPDETMDFEDWYIEGAYATNADGKTYTKYDAKNHKDIFDAICAAVLANRNLCDIILETSREHGE